MRDKYYPSPRTRIGVSMSAKNWCFTWNGADESKYDNLATHFTEGNGPTDCQYIIFQLEKGESGNVHIQGYVQFTKRASFTQVKDNFGRLVDGAHIEKAKGSAKQNKLYCSKEETRLKGPYEYGLMTSAGKRTDIDEFVAAMPMTEDEIYERFPSIMAKYPRFVRECTRRHRRPKPVHFEPRGEWQLSLAAYLETPPDRRKITWYTDLNGNNGKSYFANNYRDGLGYVITGGRHADIYYAYSYEPIVFFDWPRAQEDAFPYAVVESFKNGYFLSTKYESAPVKFPTPHVIVFANFEPIMEKLSLDRWNVINI